ncbi:hypothetical protein H0H87_012324 [Tephrocybe sp. NHM501043]|nr:hypothetical protein H0H87_012324 [Tephrocybe sp. NHM501043]
MADVPTTTDALYQVKLLQALRNGDPSLIHPFLAEIGKDKRKSHSSSTDVGTSDMDTGAAALHLAIRCATAPTVALLLSHRAISPNGVHPPGSGTTALHLAASLGRLEIVQMLLEQEGINDSLRDTQGKSAKDVARGKDVLKAIQDSHTFLNASYRSLLHSYLLSPASTPPSAALISLLESPRTRFVDLSYLDSTTGSSLLHESARRHDLRLIELAVRAGADVFVRDRRGRLPGEGLGKLAEDERVKVFLKQFKNHDSTLLAEVDAGREALEPPSMKGYLNKYTNVAKGYNTRWFVLKNDYRHQSDETIASRGSVSLKSATLKLPLPSPSHLTTSTNPPSRISTTSQLSTSTSKHLSPAPSMGASPSTSSDRTKIEVHAHGQKWYMKANHPVEAARWAAALRKSVEWARREDGEASSASVTASLRHRVRGDGTDRENEGRLSGESGESFGRSVRSKAGTLLRKGGKGRSPVARETTASPAASPVLGIEHKEEVDSRDEAGEDGDLDEDEYDDGANDGGSETGSGGEGGGRHPPHEGEYELQGNAAFAQLELTMQLVSTLASGSSSGIASPLTSASPSAYSLAPTPSTPFLPGAFSPISSTSAATTSGNATALSTPAPTPLLAALQTAHGLLSEHLAMSRDRDVYFRAQATLERRRQAVWAESLATVVREGEGLERELRTRSRRRGSRFFDGGDSVGTSTTLRSRRGKIGLNEVFEKEEGEEKEKTPTIAAEAPVTTSPVAAADLSKVPTAVPAAAAAPIQAKVLIPPPIPLSIIITPTSPEILADEEGGTDEEDEFFDAIESGTLPGLIVPEALSALPLLTPILPTPSSITTLPLFRSHPELHIPAAPYEAYTKLRGSLDINEERPSTSLWSVLKHSIGKDLTKISFPVFFNEPTSMLQRMAEDMEFTECLDAAVKEKDPLRRLAFVSAFAMSNYSSTIGRIAKPFNPMLSETFEYVRLDKEFRYYSEQVSHHPPISACWAEAPTWHYYGEVDAQNKFMGKSFEIRPTGIAHAELILPAERGGKGYPRAPERFGKEKVVEHYSWKKVTTNVSGFILGSPTIDHYGDMIVTNHRTGDQCVLTFKPRGWRGKDAFEIAGEVIDASGRVAYRIAGRWNSQLIASPASHTTHMLNPDLELDSDDSSSPSSRPTSSVPAHFLLWRNSEKRVGSPFNLTPFAITLNDCPKTTLVPYLCPTDCRLRPDQRAFEMGKWELANDLKNQQEQKQRAIRKAREDGRMAPHRPRWFAAETDGDTGERVWTPSRTEDGTLEYWSERERVFEEGGKGKTKWKDVDDIFIEAPDSIAYAL